jgi:hypothetical protein
LLNLVQVPSVKNQVPFSETPAGTNAATSTPPHLTTPGSHNHAVLAAIIAGEAAGDELLIEKQCSQLQKAASHSLDYQHGCDALVREHLREVQVSAIKRKSKRLSGRILSLSFHCLPYAVCNTLSSASLSSFFFLSL